MPLTFFVNRRAWLPMLVAAIAIPGLATAAQPGPDDPPVTYEVQIDGESFQVESGQPPKKFESKVKKGVTYTLGVRVSLTQILRLNTVQMEYGMWSTVQDNKGKDIRVAIITKDDGTSLRVDDLGHRMDEKPAEKWLDLRVSDAEKGYAKEKASVISKKGPIDTKFGQSSGKWTKISYKDAAGEAFTEIFFVLSGEKYTVAAECKFHDKDSDDAMPWLRSALGSIQPSH
jgi:hypothetical protein